MVELTDASLMLKYGPGPEKFVREMDGMEYRFVDLAGNDQTWTNCKESATVEFWRPSISDLANLACIVGKLKPDRIEYMYACGNHRIVYWMLWRSPKENKNENPD